MMEDINTRQKVDSIGISSPRMHLKNLVSALKTIGKNGYILISYLPLIKKRKIKSSQPSRHMTLNDIGLKLMRRDDVTSTSSRRINVSRTSFQRHVHTGHAVA